ncbi:multidrug transporter [Acetobacter sp. AN02]|uniref:MATE family efflux transporter n=1 Tax=Acetobacter sp. AN02 TaxID=2894186 RepID=UPI002434510C|nr:MATE family efflux transporter [Acetobacter sp. AN02]MDG6094949.1 multidrug transporter [Acetobacter sp. AN02]
MRHVLTMTSTGAIGLTAVFAVDLLNLAYIAHLGDPSLTAAIGYAGAVSGLQIAVSIGMTIGLGACVGRLIGAGQCGLARRVAASFLATMVIISTVLGLVTAVAGRMILHWMKAPPETLEQAAGYLWLVSPFLPLVVLGMGTSALLRSVGDAKGAMNVTLIGAVVTALLDPLLIFGLHEGLTGAAVSAVLARGVVAGVGLRRTSARGAIGRLKPRFILADSRRIRPIAVPAVLTNLATPLGSVWVTGAMSQFGLSAVAGQAAVSRSVVVAFAFIFSLSGSVGPVMAQNLGAGQIGRVREVLIVAVKIITLSVAVMWGVLWLTQDLLVEGFHLSGAGGDLVRLFCNWTVVSWFFMGFLFIANSAFNNLGHPVYSTLFNWGRATLGTIPLVMYGARYGAGGVQIGEGIGVVVFGALALRTAFGVVSRLPQAVVCPVGETVRSDIPAISPEGAMVDLDDMAAAQDEDSRRNVASAR